ncbi:uncharacterized protein Z518_06588 [Rhinocladiella mackenziei CBS 650.93]|uniref:CFEM domain-containing protein n=1 Tax=Rhinocladiella mackenziei CBS 650.93 TaxID=1442369 RepID=A0A0D2GXY9_9EURO|nr:uncharacterized protein Z518_06588 [Rhinocladiella mackenziei CBS 650.93]KIX03038.1 hypothetical protein Z518_06588 [Rhinocladiella mackenziei CBS 650.93]
MKPALTAGLVVSVLVLQQATAVSWGDAPSFANPSNTNNNCSADQQSGFDWSGLPTGGFNSYGGFGFNGFSCKDSFQPSQKRSLQTRSDFQSKCIQGKVGQSANRGPNFSCAQDEKFSITHMQVSVSFDTDLDFIFSMPDGSTCKHTAACQPGGTTVENTQCGGARSVSFQLPPSSSDKSDCDIGIHSIAFDCHSSSSSATTTSPASITTTLVTTTTTSAVTTTSNVETTITTTPKIETTTTTPEVVPVTSSTVTTATTTKPEEISSTSATTPTSAEETPSTSTISKPGEETPSTAITTTPVITTTPAITTTIPTETIPGTTETQTETTDVLTTEIIVSTLTTCPVTFTRTTGTETVTETTSTISTVIMTSTSTVCTRCNRPPPSTFSSATPSPSTETTTSPPETQTQPPSTSTTVSPSPPESSAPCPSVLPRCLNTWLSLVPTCSSNSDVNCFCPSADIISNVQACVSAWAGSDDEITAALSYLAGICADFVPQNPGICTGVPHTITLIPTPAASGTGTATATATLVETQIQTQTVTNGNGRGPRPPTSNAGPTSAPVAVPVTTVTFMQTASGTVITSAVTVPQVAFVTAQATGPATTGGVGLFPMPAATTGFSGSGSDASGSGCGGFACSGAGAGAGVVTTAVASTTAGFIATASSTGITADIFTGAASSPSHVNAFPLLAGAFGVVAFLV